MLGFLEGIEEYNNAGALIGIEGIDDNELLGALKRMNPIKRMRTVNKLASTGAASKGSRAEMEKTFWRTSSSYQRRACKRITTPRRCNNLFYKTRIIQNDQNVRDAG